MDILKRIGWQLHDGIDGLDYRVPLLTAGVLFAFAIDHDLVFFSRVSENRLEGYDGQSSIRKAIAETGPITTAAGTMMAICLSSLMMAHTAFVRMLGFIFVVGVVLDVLVVRMLVAPILICWAGDLAFWPQRMPKAKHMWDADSASSGRVQRSERLHPWD